MTVLKTYATAFNGYGFGWHLGAPEPTDRPLRAYIKAAPTALVADYAVFKTLNQGNRPTCIGACGDYWGIADPVNDPWGEEMIEVIYALCKRIDGDTIDGSTIHSLAKALGPGAPGVTGMNRLVTAAFAQSPRDGDDFMLGGGGGIMYGMPWFQDMMKVWPDGLVHPTGRLIGGHAVFCKRTDRTVARRGFKQSWGLIPEFPNGYFEIADQDMEYLWSLGCEAAAAVELPLGPQPPGPVPPMPPAPDGCLNLLATLSRGR